MQRRTFSPRERAADPRATGSSDLVWFGALVGLALLAYLVARWPMGAWTIDDAGISFSYARSISAGEGSTVFAEGMAVEGFSNPLTVALYGVLARLDLFHPLLTHVPVELCMFALCTGLVFLWLREAGIGRRTASLAGFLFAALQLLTPATLIWYSSGLENLQLTTAIAALLWIHQRWLRGKTRASIEVPLFLAISLIRPEAFLYPLAVGVAYLIHLGLARRGAVVRTSWRHLALVFGVVAVLGALVIAARVQIFGEYLPNTYYAKASGAFQTLKEPTGLGNFRQYVVGGLLRYQGTWLFLAIGVLGSVLGRRHRQAFCLLLLGSAAVALPSYSGPDWMGEHRFGTALITVAHLWAVFGLAACVDHLRARPPRFHAWASGAIAVMAVALMGWCAWTGLPRYREFVKQPHATFENVADSIGFARLELQERLGLFAPNALIADAGGSTFVGQLQAIDLLRLTDYHMARIHRSKQQVLSYLYAERGCELIEAHHRIPTYPAFHADYFPAVRFANPHSGGPIRYFARRDLVQVDRSPSDTALIGSAAGIELWRSSRNVPFTAPGGIARIEILVGKLEESDEARRIRVCLERECDELAPFQFHTLGGSSLRPVPGRLYRQAFLLRSPEESGPAKVTLEVWSEHKRQFRQEIGEVSVGTTLGENALISRLEPGAGPFLDRAFLLAQLERQARPRLRRGEIRRLLASYRKAATSRSWSVVSLFRKVAADFDAPIHPDLKAELDELRASMVGELERHLRRGLDRRGPRKRANAQLNAATTVFNLRRLGFRDLGRDPAVQEIRERLRSQLANESRTGERYRLALLMIALEPRDVDGQKALLQARRRVAGARRARPEFSPAFYRRPGG